jgi:hypothetical protein
MEIKLNLEQVSYLKGLDSKKKQRKFLLDCLVGMIIGESVKKIPSIKIIMEDGICKITDPDAIAFLNKNPSLLSPLESEKLNKFISFIPKKGKIETSKMTNSPSKKQKT